MNAVSTRTEFNLSAGRTTAAVIHDMFEHVSDRANRLSCPKGSWGGNKPDGKTTAYVCIHLDTDQFVYLMNRAIPHVKIAGDWNAVKFLDVGCGVGQKVYMAERLFTGPNFYIKGHGLELRPHHVKIARQTLKAYMTPTHRSGGEAFGWRRIMQANAITFKKYSDYDIIYFYCPSPEHETEIEIERAIARGAKVGAVAITCLSHWFENGTYKDEVKKLGWVRIDRQIWKRQSLGEA